MNDISQSQFNKRQFILVWKCYLPTDVCNLQHQILYFYTAMLPLIQNFTEDVLHNSPKQYEDFSYPLYPTIKILSVDNIDHCGLYFNSTMQHIAQQQLDNINVYSNESFQVIIKLFKPGLVLHLSRKVQSCSMQVEFYKQSINRVKEI